MLIGFFGVKKNFDAKLAGLCSLCLTLLLFSVSCFTRDQEDSGYWTRGCICPDQRTMAAIGSEAVLIDLVSGKPTHKTRGYFNDVVCFPDNKAVALGPEQAVWLNTGQKNERQTNWALIGPLEENKIVVSFRNSWKGSILRSWDGPLNLKVETIDGSNAVNVEPFRLVSEAFPVLGQEPVNYLEIIPIRLLADKRLLVAAGYGSTKFEQQKPWNFFTVQMKSGAVSPFGPMRKGDDDLNLFVRSTKFASTPDGEILAGSSGKTIVVLNSENPAPVTRIRLENIKEIQQLQFNQDGTLLAAGLTGTDGGSGRIEVFDSTNGNRLWQTEDHKGVIYFLQFLQDDSLAFFRSTRIVSRRRGNDGKVVY